MMDMTMNFNDPFTWLLMFTMFAAMVISLLPGSGALTLAIIIVGSNAMMMHENLQKEADKAFVYERFSAGEKIECGLWRGSRTIADPAKGWILEEERFIKDDQILTDASLCSVVDKSAPEVSWISPFIFFLTMVLVFGLGRLGMYESDGRHFFSGERKEPSKLRPRDELTPQNTKEPHESV